MNNKIDMFGFIAKLALECRLSLKNICKILKIKETEENKKFIYEKIIETLGNNNYEKNKYNYLFGYETVVEPQEVSKKSYNNAIVKKIYYDRAELSGDKDKINLALQQLHVTDLAYINLKKKDLSNLDLKDTEIISRYRLKHNISREAICSELSISPDVLRVRELKLPDEVLKYKLLELNKYMNDLKLKTRKK